jgi:hypothetical protein
MTKKKHPVKRSSSSSDHYDEDYRSRKKKKDKKKKKKTAQHRPMFPQVEGEWKALSTIDSVGDTGENSEDIVVKTNTESKEQVATSESVKHLRTGLERSKRPLTFTG